jgi:hypothetical protein
VYSIDPANRKVTIPSGSTFEQEGTQEMGDSDALAFGDASDVSFKWDGTNFLVLPVADDTGIFKFGNGTVDMDVRMTLGVAADFFAFDVGAKSLRLDGDVRLDFSSATVVAANTDGGIIKGGTSSAKITESTADMKFISFYFSNGATSGDSRGIYLRQYITGVGGGGDAARFYSTVTNVAAATVRGAHISLDFDASGTVTGLGVALETTLHIPDDATQAGTLASLKVAINSDGASSDITGSSCSFLRFDNQGHATGMAKIDAAGFLFDIDGLTAGSGKLLATQSAGAYPSALVATLKIQIGSTTYYIPLQNAQAA